MHSIVDNDILTNLSLHNKWLFVRIRRRLEHGPNGRPKLNIHGFARTRKAILMSNIEVIRCTPH